MFKPPSLQCLITAVAGNEHREIAEVEPRVVERVERVHREL